MNNSQILAFLSLEHELMRVVQLALGKASQPIIQGLLLEPIDPDSAIWKRFADDQTSRGVLRQLLSDSILPAHRVDYALTLLKRWKWNVVEVDLDSASKPLKDAIFEMIEERAVSVVSVDYAGQSSLGIQSLVDAPAGTYFLGLHGLEIETEAKTEEELRTWGVSGLSLGGNIGDNLTVLTGPVRLMNHSCIPSAALVEANNVQGLHTPQKTITTVHLAAGDAVTIYYGASYFGPFNVNWQVMVTPVNTMAVIN